MSLLNNKKTLLGAVILLGIVLRLFAFQFNDYIHGDVWLFASVTKSAVERGDLYIPHDPSVPHAYDTTTILKSPPYEGGARGGRLADQHPPLWSLMGAPFYSLGVDAFTALKILSLLFGIILMPLTWALAKKYMGEKVAFWSTLAVATSWVLADFSANGSLYILQAAIFLPTIPLISNLGNFKKNILLGLLLGLAYLINYQTLILLLAVIVAPFVTSFSYKKNWRNIILTIAVMFLVVSPWLMRNQIVFGSPLYNINITYVWQKLGVEQTIENNVVEIHTSSTTYINAIKKSLTQWFPLNLYYLNRKLFVLAPLLYIFFLLSFIKMIGLRKFLQPQSSASLRRGKRGLNSTKTAESKSSGRGWADKIGVRGLFDSDFSRRSSAVANFRQPNHNCWRKVTWLIVILYILIATVWPVTKFRYFIPLIPLVTILGFDYFFSLSLRHPERSGAESKDLRRMSGLLLSKKILLTLTILLHFAFSLLTFLSTPAHTTYFDGLVTEDPFGKRGEAEFIENYTQSSDYKLFAPYVLNDLSSRAESRDLTP